MIRLVDMFRKNAKIGMIGLLGGRSLPENRRFYRSWDAGNVLGCNDKKAFWNALGEDAAQVWAVDGMFMMTQYDVAWREDVLDGWDFYDFSQSIEFADRGYEVWVPEQKEPWSIHDCGYLSLDAYDERFVDTEFVILRNLLTILQSERCACEKKCFLDGIMSFEEAYARYRRVKYWLWKQRYVDELVQEPITELVSETAVAWIKEHCLLQ